MKIFKNISSFLIVLFLFLSPLSANQISDSTLVQIVLVSPGKQLYSIFGHSAFRFYDYKNNLDITFNFGTFNPEEKNFIIKFLKGTLNYYLSKSSFQNLLLEAYYEKRSVFVHTLNLNYNQKLFLYNYLDSLHKINYSYRYKFFKDNCATKIRDLVFLCYNDSLNIEKKNIKCSFRDCLDPYLKSHPFFGNGINILLGNKVDIFTNEYERMFLPDTLSILISHASYKNRVISDNLRPIFTIEKEKNEIEIVFSYIILTLIFVLFLTLYYKILIRKSYTIEDFALNTLFFIVGIVILLMWTFSCHYEVKYNFNILWANPLTLLLVFFNKNKKLYNIISFILFLFCLILFIFHFLGIQKFTLFVIVLNLLLLIKYFFVILVKER